MTKIDVPLKIYSKYVWLSAFVALISYIIVLVRITETDPISGFLVFLSVATSLTFGFKIAKDGMTYYYSKGAK